MMRKPCRSGAVFAFSLIAFCGSAGMVMAADENEAEIASDTAITTVEVGTLPPQELEEGKCGLFLWTNASEPRLVFVSINDGNARMLINGEDLALARNAAEGREYLGQFESQSFYSPEMSVVLSMEVERRPTIVDGAVVPSATLRVTEPNGWETVIPVGGLIGCGTA